MIRRPKNIAGRFLKKFSVLVLILIAVSLGGFFWWRWATSPVSQDLNQSQIFVIHQGESLSFIAQQLANAGLIKNATAFKILVLAKGLSGQIQAGDFRVKPAWTTEEIAYLLTHGSLDVWLTFPEGWRREEYDRRLTSNLDNFSYSEFLTLTQNKEGFLFPDTYLIPKDASPSAVMTIFTNNFEKKFDLEMTLAAKDKGLTQEQVIILASIVERETRTDKDRPIVAGILLKRWQENWPLQADATIQYALANQKNIDLEDWQAADWWPQITKADLKISSSYNTYKNKGLPPTPICNPGLASLNAVIHPQESDYWFYLSDNQGVMHYAKTSEEHNGNIEQFLR
jgi:UPF0755 protein